MKICFEPLPDIERANNDQLSSFAAHIRQRQVEVVGFDELAVTAGMVAEYSQPLPGLDERVLEVAQKFKLPILMLAEQGQAFIPSRLAELPAIWAVHYSSTHNANVAIDVFLEAHCGYRVPLGADGIPMSED